MPTENWYDPVDVARQWLANNPDDEAAVHVATAIGSADRYERLCSEMEQAQPGTRVVLVTYMRGNDFILTTPERRTEQEIAGMIAMYNAYKLGIRKGFEEVARAVKQAKP